MVGKVYFVLVLAVISSCKSSSPNPVDSTVPVKLQDSPRQQNAAQVLVSDSLKPTRSYSIKQHPYYAPHIIGSLSNLVAQHGKSKRNHFYISKVKEYSSGYPDVWIYWKESRILMTWDPNTGSNKKGEYAPELDLDSLWPRHVYRLDKDLVNGPYADGNDRLTRRAATEIIRDCKLQGDLFVTNHVRLTQ